MSEEEHNAWIRRVIKNTTGKDVPPGEEMQAYEEWTQPERPFVLAPERSQEPVISPHEKIRLYHPDLEQPVPQTPDLPERSAGVKPEREYVPVSRSPTPARTKPFLPSRPVPESIRHTTPAKIRQPENSPENSTRAEILDEFLPESNKNAELKQPGGGESKPTTPLQPKFITKPFDRQAAAKKRGRQRAKDRHTHMDGVRQLFELWWHKGSGGVAFSTFYRNHLSRDMRAYYPREYIYGANAKSHTEYQQWRSEWDTRHSSSIA